MLGSPPDGDAGRLPGPPAHRHAARSRPTGILRRSGASKGWRWSRQPRRLATRAGDVALQRKALTYEAALHGDLGRHSDGAREHRRRHRPGPSAWRRSRARQRCGATSRALLRRPATGAVGCGRRNERSSWIRCRLRPCQRRRGLSGTRQRRQRACATRETASSALRTGAPLAAAGQCGPMRRPSAGGSALKVDDVQRATEHAAAARAGAERSTVRTRALPPVLAL